MVVIKTIFLRVLVRIYLVATLSLSCCGFYSAYAQASENKPFKQQSAIMAALVSQSLLVDIKYVHGRWFVAGERGHILYSDNGKDWKQAMTPTQNMITSVFFLTENQGWAVGHDAVILYTEDKGESWRLQYSNPENETPLMDVFFLDEKKGLAIGAYGFYLVSEDGGESWTEKQLDVEMDRHLNALFEFNNDLFIAGESGIVYRSEDRGDTWQQMELPYSGSLFGVSKLNNNELVVFGLQGKAFRSADRGQSWQVLPMPVKASLLGHALLDNGCSVFTGTGGTLLLKCPGQNDFQRLQYPAFNDLIDVSFVDSKNLLIVGEKGVELFPLQ